jgi:hypothetical protein
VCCGSRLWARVARALLAGAVSRSGTDCPEADADTFGMASYEVRFLSGTTMVLPVVLLIFDRWWWWWMWLEEERERGRERSAS